MSILRQLGTNSAIYVVANLAQKGAAFLLLPLYTSYLSPGAYGTLAVVTAINGFLAIAFTLALTGAVTRFYFDFAEDPEALSEFWGTIVTAVLLLSAVVGTILLVFGEPLIRPFIGEVPFWPFVALGIGATFFQPLFTTYLGVLQTRNQAGLYAVFSVGSFLFTTAIAVALVAGMGWGAEGPLVATLIGAATFFAIAMWMLRRDVRLGLKWRHLRPALAYSLPQVPHAAAAQITAITDRLVLNGRLGAATTGVYAVGAMIAMVVDIVGQSFNRSYVPLSMAALTRGTAEDFAELRTLGGLMVGSACFLGIGVAVFSAEAVALLTTADYAKAAAVVPLLAFGGVVGSAYYVFVNILFYDRSATRLLPIGTLAAASLNVGLALLLIPRFGFVGAAAATLLSQTAVTVLIAVIGKRYDPVAWPYLRYAAAIGVSFAGSMLLSRIELPGVVATVGVKAAGVAVLTFPLSAFIWSRPSLPLRVVRAAARFGPRGALALFVSEARAA